MKHATTFLFAVALVTTMPFSAHAFKKDTVEQNVETSEDRTLGVYSLTVPVGAFNRAIYIPILGQRDLSHGTRANYFGYSLENSSGERTDDGTTLGLALADAQVVDGMYLIPVGRKVDVTFMVTAQITSDESDSYRMTIGELPFFYGSDKEPNHFSTGELKYLVTNYEALNLELDSE